MRSTLGSHVSGLAIAICLTSCRPAPGHGEVATSNEGLALRWRVSQGLWGTEVFEVRRDGHGHYRFDPVGGGDRAKSFDVTVTPTALQAIAEAAVGSRFCEEHSGRLGIPDEGKPTLELFLPGATCSVTLWDGEWRDQEGPKSISAMISALHEKK